MADDGQQQPGSTIGAIASGLGKVAQYALPAALGAAMGGLGGAAAGLGMGAEGIQESQDRDQERQMRQSELALRWQQFGLESQQAQMALASAKSWQDYTGTLPKDERALAMENPQEYTKNKIEAGQWKLSLESLEKDPDFAKAHGANVNEVAKIKALGPTLGKPLLEKYLESSMSGKYPNGVHVMTNADGTTSLMGVGPNGETTLLASGVAPKTLPTPPSAEAKAKQQLDVNKEARKRAEDDAKARWWLSGDKRDKFVKDQTEKYKQELGGEGGSKPSVPSSDVTLPSSVTTTSAAMKYLTMNKGMSTADARSWIRAHAAD